MTTAQNHPELDPNKLLVLLAGQSNMAGRGLAGPDDLESITGLLAIRPDGEWAPAVEPITKDRPFIGTFCADGTKIVSPDPWDTILPADGQKVVGVGPGRTFGRLLREANPDRTVGLIPTAVGGTPISSWKPGGIDPVKPESHPFDQAIRLARTAQQSGRITAILWHQGETDAKNINRNYTNDLREVILNFYRELDLDESVPFIAGELADFYRPAIQEHIELVDHALEELATELPFVRIVRLKGLGHRGDNLHFDTAAQHEFGRRCFVEYTRFQAQ